MKENNWKWKKEAFTHILPNGKKLSKSALSSNPTRYYCNLYPNLVKKIAGKIYLKGDKVLSVRVTPDVYSAWSGLAKSQNVSVSECLRDAVTMVDKKAILKAQDGIVVPEELNNLEEVPLEKKIEKMTDKQLLMYLFGKDITSKSLIFSQQKAQLKKVIESIKKDNTSSKPDPIPSLSQDTVFTKKDDFDDGKEYKAFLESFEEPMPPTTPIKKSLIYMQQVVRDNVVYLTFMMLFFLAGVVFLWQILNGWMFINAVFVFWLYINVKTFNLFANKTLLNKHFNK